jgi:Bacteriophage clamp loader A subunit
MSSPFDYINAISHTKENIISGTDNDELAEKGYEPYLVNRGLSFFPDTVLYANEMNMRHVLSKKCQFSYLLNTVRPRKRFSKWFKANLEDDIKIVSEYYGYSISKAREAMRVLTQDNIAVMRKKLEKGGMKTPKEKKNDSDSRNTIGDNT